MGRHSAGELYAGAAPPAAPQQPAPRQPGSRQSSRPGRRSLLPVFGSLAVLAVAAGTSMVLAGGKVPAGPADHRAAYSAGAAAAAAKPEPEVAASPVAIGFAGMAQVSPAAPAHPRKPAPVTSAPARTPATQAPAQPASPVSALADLPVNTDLTGSAAVAWAKAALAALGAPASSANIQTMLDWFNNEGTPHDYNNPLNLNTPYGGSTTSTADGDPPDVHIQAYPTPADFAQAFAIQIGDNPSYPAITAALKSGEGLEGSAASGEIASELEVYSGGGYDSIPGTP